jgi:hypothetical protein
MLFNEYQKRALSTAQFPSFKLIAHDSAVMQEEPIDLIYPTLGLVGECYELFEKVHEAIEFDELVLNADWRSLVVLELGDILWYVAVLSDKLGHNLSVIATHDFEVSDVTFESWIMCECAGCGVPPEDYVINSSTDLLCCAGQFAECVKKVLRDSLGNINFGDQIRLGLILHKMLVMLGLSAISINSTFNHIAIKNIEKLESRKARNVISGSGDLR